MHKQEELVAVEHGFHLGGILGAFDSLFLDAVAHLLDGGGAVALAHLVGQSLLHLGGDILHAYQYRGGQAGVGQLLLLGVGPEAVAQVVVLHGRVLLKLAVSAVVVGADKTLFRDNLTGAEVPEGAAGIAETHDGVFQTVLVDTVDVFRRKFETSSLHIGIILADKRQEPHALVGAGRHRQQHAHCESDNQNTNFHCVISFYD